MGGGFVIAPVEPLRLEPAHQPPTRRDEVRLLIVDSQRGPIADSTAAALPSYLAAGDLVVVNDAATLPASLHGTTAGHAIEVRLLPSGAGVCRAVLFGAGDWRTDTAARPPPPRVGVGDLLQFDNALTARVLAVSAQSPRLIDLAFIGGDAALWPALYAAGHPVQYSYQQAPLELWSVQTVYASRPWAAEMPSAGRPLTWATLLALRRRGIAVAHLTHAAGLSATGDAALDAALPLAERYEIPQHTAQAIAAARARGGRVIAVGTTVVRALESAAARPSLAGAGITELRLDADFTPRIVSGIITGLHAPSESHFELLRAFASQTALESALQHAANAGYRSHELGDIALILATKPLREDK